MAASSDTSEIHISGTEDDPSVQAQAQLCRRGDELLHELTAKVSMATELTLSSADREQARDRLVKFCAQRVRPELQVSDRALYAVAAGAAESRLLVRALRVQHEAIEAEISTLNRAESAEQVVAAAHVLVALLQDCQRIEQLVLLPSLAVLPGVEMSALLADVETLAGGGNLDSPEELDVREIPHGRRHPRIFGIYSRLGPGESFVLVNNHDPKPLRREFEATYPDQFGWDYLQSGPKEWRVRIERLPAQV